ncbi:MAG: cytochrome c3 family protein [Polyangiales bacterium]
MTSIRWFSWLSFCVCASFVMVACTGDTGEPGPQGPPGEPGPPGETPGEEIDPELEGLVGRVMEPNMTPVQGGTVYLVPASDVEDLSETEIDLFLSPEATAMLEVDEPIEDLLDVNGTNYEQAAVDDSGEYRFVTLPEGEHFIVWAPADGDGLHLPGGDSSSVAFDTASLIGMQMDIRVSAQPSENATYVGSSTCLGCHALHSTSRTAHNVGLQVPGSRSILQDVEPWPSFDDGLEGFEAGTSLYYYDCDAAASTHEDPSNCKVQVQNPGPSAKFRIDLRRDTNTPLGVIGAYFIQMENLINGQPTRRYDVVLTYGGALGAQQYLTRRSNADESFSYFLLPLQYNYEGDFDNGSLPGNGTSDDWPWRDYRSDLWFDFDTDMLRDSDLAPSSADSFDNNCAGCHFTGYALSGSEMDGWSASAVVDSGGAFDYDGDGRLELLNVGCESCHGAGSDHLNPSPNGSFMVSPGLLTPGRQAALCGSCHSRPLGIGAGETGLPLSDENEMPPPGIRRADFAANYTNRVGGAPAAFFDSGDEKAHYQQYSGHIQTRHYRNGTRLVSCTNCHSPHANDDDIAAMDTSGNPNALCTTCHSGLAEPDNLDSHVESATGNSVHSGFGLLCADCHLVPTARSGAAVPALLDPGSGVTLDVQYFWNDIATHRMTMTPWRDVGEPLEQPVAFTNECGTCHANLLPNPPAP